MSPTLTDKGQEQQGWRGLGRHLIADTDRRKPTAAVLRQHVPSLALADGLSLEECDALADWRASKLFSASERAVLAYADNMTREIAVPDAVFAEVKRHFNDREIVELTGVM